MTTGRISSRCKVVHSNEYPDCLCYNVSHCTEHCRYCSIAVDIKETEMTEQNSKRPDIVEDEHLEFLDDLRESGVTNMFGAGEYVTDEFGLDRRDASAVVQYWMKSFGKEDR